MWSHLGKVPGSLGISGNLRPLSEECLSICEMWVNRLLSFVPGTVKAWGTVLRHRSMVSDRRRCLDWRLWKLPTLRRTPGRLDVRDRGVVCVVVHLDRWHGGKPRLLIALLSHPHRIALQANFVLPLVAVRMVKRLVEHGCSWPLTTFHPLVSLLSARLPGARGRGKDWPHIVRRVAAGFLRGFLLS